jgi:hypothetical protein
MMARPPGYGLQVSPKFKARSLIALSERGFMALLTKR